MLENAGPIRNDGSDKFWGMENVSQVQPCILCLLTYTSVWQHMVCFHQVYHPPAN